MFVRVVVIIISGLLVSACVKGPYTAFTPFIVSESHEKNQAVTVGNHEPFFIHQVQYKNQVMLQDSLDNGSKTAIKLSKGSELFAINVRLENMPGEALAGKMSQTLYCGLISKQSGFSKFMTGAEGGDDLRCFLDNNNDGLFETVYVAVGAMHDPLTVYVVQRDAKILEKPMPYKFLSNSDKVHVGQVWFQVRSPLFGDKVVDFYIGREKEKSMLGTVRLNDIKKGQPKTFTLGGAMIEASSIKDGKVSLKLLRPIELMHEYTIVKTVTTTYIPVYY